MQKRSLSLLVLTGVLASVAGSDAEELQSVPVGKVLSVPIRAPDGHLTRTSYGMPDSEQILAGDDIFSRDTISMFKVVASLEVCRKRIRLDARKAVLRRQMPSTCELLPLDPLQHSESGRALASRPEAPERGSLADPGVGVGAAAGAVAGVGVGAAVGGAIGLFGLWSMMEQPSAVDGEDVEDGGAAVATTEAAADVAQASDVPATRGFHIPQQLEGKGVSDTRGNHIGRSAGVVADRVSGSLFVLVELSQQDFRMVTVPASELSMIFDGNLMFRGDRGDLITEVKEYNPELFVDIRRPENQHNPSPATTTNQ